MAEQDAPRELQLKLRFGEDLRDRLALTAGRNGASLNSEIVRRLEDSLAAEERVGGPATAALLGSIAADIADIEAATGQGWTVDLRTYGAVRYAIAETVADLMPVPRDYAARVRDAIAEQKAVVKVSGFVEDILTDGPASSLFAPADVASWKQTYPDRLHEMATKAVAQADDVLDAISQEADRGREVFQEILDQREQIARLRKRT